MQLDITTMSLRRLRTSTYDSTQLQKQYISIIIKQNYHHGQKRWRWSFFWAGVTSNKVTVQYSGLTLSSLNCLSIGKLGKSSHSVDDAMKNV